MFDPRFSTVQVHQNETECARVLGYTFSCKVVWSFSANDFSSFSEVMTALACLSTRDWWATSSTRGRTTICTHNRNKHRLHIVLCVCVYPHNMQKAKCYSIFHNYEMCNLILCCVCLQHEMGVAHEDGVWVQVQFLTLPPIITKKHQTLWCAQSHKHTCTPCLLCLLGLFGKYLSSMTQDGPEMKHAS